MPPTWGVPLPCDARTRAIKEEAGDAHGSRVEGGLLTHSSALARSRAAPHGVQPSHNPPKPQNRARSQRGGQGKQAMEALDCPNHPAEIYALLSAPENAPPFRASPPGGKLPVHTAEVFCIQRGASSATFTQPPETLRPRFPPAPPLHPRNLHRHQRRPAPHPASRRPPSRPGERGPPPSPRNQSPQTHTHPPQAPTSGTPSKPERVPGPVGLRGSQGAGAVPSQRRRALRFPPTVVASLFPRKRREERCGRGGGRRGAEGRQEPSRNH